MRVLTIAGLLSAGLFASTVNAGNRLDCWWETPSLFFLNDGDGKRVDLKNPDWCSLDFADKQSGDFSVRLTTRPKSGPLTVGFSPGAYQRQWELAPSSVLRFWIKASIDPQPKEWSLVFTDANGLHANGTAAGAKADGQWHDATLPLNALKAESHFDVTRIASVRIDVPLSETAPVWLDDVRWENPSSSAVVGVTDKTVVQRMAEARTSLPARRQEAFTEGSDTDATGRDRQLYDQLLSGRNPQEANAQLRAFYTDELQKCASGHANLWHLTMNVRLIDAYYHLGSKSGSSPLLEPETEKLLLKLLWERTKDKNDIAISRWSTWWMVGSENHDLNAKSSNLITSRIFMNEPDYASRPYPDAGHGDGHGYWFHGITKEGRDLGPDGRANLSDGKQHTAKDHYTAWVAYMKDYLAERAKKGFFLERSSPTYFKYTTSFVQIVHDFSGDEALRDQARQFLDLLWADWAQEQIAGIRGGPKTRHTIVGGYDSQTDLARFYLGGSLTTLHSYGSQLFSDYQWPAVVWELALDREGLGSFETHSRGVGEEEATRPRPPGTERSMLGNVELRFVKYSWVTPQYILGTQMDHPDARYNHLAVEGRWQGLIVGQEPAARVVLFVDQPPKGEAKDAKDAKVVKYTVGSVWQSVQDRRVLITQQARRWTAIHPEWYPATDNYSQPIAIYLGTAWDIVDERNGWVFVCKGDTYAAIRVIDSQKGEIGDVTKKSTELTNVDDDNQVLLADQTYDWSDDRATLRLRDKFSPVILEAGSRTESGTFKEFQQAVLANPLKLYKTAVPGYFIVSYRGAGSGAKEIVYNAANPSLPEVGGQYIDYSPAKVFDSLFIQSVYNSGLVRIRKGDDELLLDFNRALAH